MAQYDKQCEECGRDFVAKRKNSKVCSDECRCAKADRKRNEKNDAMTEEERITINRDRSNKRWDRDARIEF